MIIKNFLIYSLLLVAIKIHASDELFKSIKLNDIDKVNGILTDAKRNGNLKELLEKVAFISIEKFPSFWLTTPLTYAVMLNNEKIFTEILKAASATNYLKALLDYQDPNGAAIFFNVIQYGNQEILNRLLKITQEYGFLQDLFESRNKDALTPLMYALHYDINIFLELFAIAKQYGYLKQQLEAKTKSGNTVLLYLIKERVNILIIEQVLDSSRELGILKEQLENREKINWQNALISAIDINPTLFSKIFGIAKEIGILEKQLTTLNINKESILLLLIEHNLSDEIIKQVLEAAKDFGLLRALLEAKNITGVFPLQLSSYKKQKNTMRLLLNAAKEMKILREQIEMVSESQKNFVQELVKEDDLTF